MAVFSVSMATPIMDHHAKDAPPHHSGIVVENVPMISSYHTKHTRHKETTVPSGVSVMSMCSQAYQIGSGISFWSGDEIEYYILEHGMAGWLMD